jgi:CzcA family heavy metal efflux pump
MPLFALSTSKLVLFVTTVLALLGLRSYLVAPQSMFPTMSFSRIDVVAEAGDLPPDQVRTTVTQPLEQALQTLPSLLRVHGTSSQGSAEVLAEFDPSTDPRIDLQYVNQALAQVRSAIPTAKSVEAVVVNSNNESVVSYALTSQMLSQTILRHLAQTRIVPLLYGTPGLGRVLLIGGSQPEAHVNLDPAALAAVGLSAQDVTNVIGSAVAVQSAGTGVTHFQRNAFLIDASIHDIAALSRIVLPLKDGSTVPLSMLGTIRQGAAPATNQASYNAQHAVILNAYATQGGNSVLMVRELNRRLHLIAGELAPNIRIVKFWDQTRLIVESQKSLRDAILLGALLAVLVIYFFLRNVRMMFIAAAIIPLAISIVLLLLERSGQSLNIMSVGGLAVAVGLIIDDAIVVLENIARRFSEEPGANRTQAIARALQELARPMIASTLTTVVVFAPLALLGGVTGYFFRSLAFTLSAALLVSLMLALLVTPILANLILRISYEDSSRKGIVSVWYAPILQWALRRRTVVAFGAIGVFVVTALLLVHLPSDFLPVMNEGQFEIRYAMPTGVSLAATDAAATTMERIIVRDPGAAGEGRITGIDTNGFSPTQQNTGTIRVALHQGASYIKVSDHLRRAIELAVPAATLSFHQILEDQIDDLSGAPSSVSITITGPQQERLIMPANQLARKIELVPGIVDPFSGVIYDDPTIRISPTSAQLASLGLQSADLVSALSAYAQSVVAAVIPQEAQMVSVRVRVGNDPLDADDADTLLFTRSGPSALGALASIAHPAPASEINDENGLPLVRVTANIGGASLSSIIAGVKAQIASLNIPPGYTVAIGGAYQAQQQSFHDFFSVFAIAATLVFIVMLADFGSFRLPLIILTTLPLALIGTALALWITHTPFNVSSFMGLLLLIGLVVKNGILLIHAVDRRRQEGFEIDEALMVAGKERLRPIVMTTFAAIGGLLPLALGTGSGAEMQKPLAIAVIGGLSTAMIFTLVVIPVLYSLFFKRVSARATGVGVAVFLFLSGAWSNGAQAETLAPAPFAFAGFSLDDAQQAALANSPDTALALAAHAEACAQLDRMRRSYGLAGNLGYAQSPQGVSGATIASRMRSAGLQLSLGDLLAYGPAVAEAVANERAAQANLDDATRLEKIKTIGLYFGALKAKAVASARQGALLLAVAQSAAAQKRADAGDAPRLDVLRAELQVAKAHADLALGQAADADASDALVRETAARSLVLVQALPTPSLTQLPSPEAAVDIAEHVRDDVRSARDGVLAAQAGVRATQRALIPTVIFGAGYSAGVDSGMHVAAPTFSVQAVLPIPSRRNDEVALQQTRLAQAQAKALSTERAVALEVAAKVRGAVAAIAVQRASNEALRLSREALTATELGYRSGASSSLETSIARSAYEQTLVDAISAMYDRIATESTLREEMGNS